MADRIYNLPSTTSTGLPSRTPYHSPFRYLLLVDASVGLNWLLGFFYHTLIKSSFIHTVTKSETKQWVSHRINLMVHICPQVRWDSKLPNRIPFLFPFRFYFSAPLLIQISAHFSASYGIIKELFTREQMKILCKSNFSCSGQ